MNSRGSKGRASPIVHVQDLVLDETIDNSLAHTLSFYSVAPSSPPYPRHVFSPSRGTPGGYSLSRDLRSRLEMFDDDFTDTLSVGKESPTSPDASAMNNFFNVGEDSSMNKYMSELADNDVFEPDKKISNSKKKTKTHRSHSMVSVFRSTQTHMHILTHLCDQIFIQQSNLTVRYHNMGNWPAESREPKAKLLLIQISEQIIFRETALQALRSALSVMDKKYWQYCVERIKATEAGRTIKSETLTTLINQLFEAQKHVAVLIAHVRSLAIELIEKVRQLRQIHAKNMKAASVVSIYWMNQNYLLAENKE